MPPSRALNKKPFVPDAFSLAQEQYGQIGVNVESALQRLATISISLQCWQGDDVRGFEPPAQAPSSNGIAATGHYPGTPRTHAELQRDIEKALSLIPGRHRVNLHASYGEFDKKTADRDAIEPAHFRNWIAWAKSQGIGLDFNPTCFAHPKSADGLTLSHKNKSIRKFWIEHAKRSREIAASMGRALGSPSVTNLWIPDGSKDTPADRNTPRQRLIESLDEIFANKLRGNIDSIEPKLFGIGSESYVVGSHELYLGYAIRAGILLCLDSGHYHPTENVADKISSILQFLPEILLHVSRGVRWDSDHVVTQNDELLALTREVIANRFEKRVRIGLDYFDASINRVAAWVIGTRALLRSLLIALLEPTEALRQAEIAGDYTSRLALQEELKAMPFGPIWDRYCEMQGVPTGTQWISEVRAYEASVLFLRA